MLTEPVRGGFPDEAIFALSGMEQLRAFLSRHAPEPPLGRLTGITVTQVGSGTASVSMPASGWLMQQEALEVTMVASRAVEAAVRSGVPPATELQMVATAFHHFRPANPESGGVIARSRVLHTGRKITVAEALVEDGSGRSVAHATASVLTRRMPEPPPDRPLAPIEEPRYPMPDPFRRAAPVPPLDERETQSAMEWAQRWADGTVPIPVAQLLGARVVEVAEQQCSMALTCSEWLCLERNQVAAAPLTALASMALYAATWTVAAQGQRLAPVHQVVDFIGGVRPDGREVLARARVTEWNGEFALASAILTDAAGNAVARAHQTAIPAGLRASQRGTAGRRLLATVMFSDIAGSTRLVETLGDARWQELLEEHYALVRRSLALFAGREVKTTGDGFLATFDSPAQAVRCAGAIREGLQRHSVQVRIGIHTGECDVLAGDLSGIAVHIASRVQSAADPGEILVSATVRDIVAGSGLRFSDRGRHALKGIEGEWQLLAVED